MRRPAQSNSETGSQDFLPLLVWLSPGFPVGSFAYSHGIEWAVEAGDVTNADTCAGWLSDLLEHGGAWSDAVLLVAAHRAAAQEDNKALREVAELAAALAPSLERRLETLKQGDAFLLATRTAWPCAALDRFAKVWSGETAFPVAVGVASAGHGLALPPTLEAYLLASVSNLVSAAVRLIPLGQTDGTKIVARLTPLAREIAARAAQSMLDDIGGTALRSDIASMRHETQYTRLFRS
ncbi:MAG: urease accessory protein UreF [Bradyrhizobiaceae bacterium]|nr:urease accessory protein UreF [Bradyrhizobiaceae bacterium]